MKRVCASTLRFLAAGLLAAGVFFPSTGDAASVVPIAVSNLAGAADVVVLGTVHAVRVERDPTGRTFTAVEVEPTEVLKGTTPPGALVVRELGGLTAAGGSVVGGSATFAPGECVLLFLRRDGPDLRLVGQAQGKFSVSRDSATAAWTATRIEPDTGRVVDQVPLARIKELLGRP